LGLSQLLNFCRRDDTNLPGQYHVSAAACNESLPIFCYTDPTALYATTYYTGHAIPSVANLLGIEDSKILTNVNVALPVAGAIHGRVTTITGQPVAGLRVTVHANLRFDQIVDLSYLVSGNTRTDRDGQYTVKGLHAGEYYVCFIGGNNYIHCYGAPSTPDQVYLVINASPVNVASGGTTSEIDLLWGSVLATYLPLIAR
jgi:hypothetical protein